MDAAMHEVKALTMDDILRADFGETKGDLVVSYKKTINTKQYESEVMEVETKLSLDGNLTGAARMTVATLLAAQLEYTCYVSMMRKNQVKIEDFMERRDELAGVCNEVCNKYKEITGKDASELVKI